MCYLNKFMPMGNMKLNHELVSIDPRKQEFTFSNGLVERVRLAGFSVALPDMIRMIHGRAAGRCRGGRALACSTCVLVNIGVES